MLLSQIANLFGLSEQEAEAKVVAAGFICRVWARDNESILHTAEHRTDRVNLTIENKKVTKVHLG